MLLTQLMIKHDENKYSEYLTKVEKVKFEMGTLYRMHPSNYVKKVDDSTGSHHLHFYYRRSNATLVDYGNPNDWEWDESRIDIIGSNGDGFPGVNHYDAR